MQSELMEAVRLFEELLPLDPERREAFLAEAPTSLGTKVRALLEGADRRGVLDGPLPSIDTTGSHPQASLAPGERLGSFTVVTLIGIGGMGEVYLAEREEPGFTQRVALKLMRIDAMPNAALFARETRLLAELDHPAIARLIDAGVTETGRPWMAMGFVEGEPLDRWCAARNPDIPTRFDIFDRICAAVVHAHARLIVHRDLKPSNVLIDAEGHPHLLDFGIAKLLDESSDEVAATTQALITPDYAAPEQFEGGPITTATDIHALGALLFEMLTGQRPWQGGGSLPAIVRRVVTEEPPQPSKVAARLVEPPVPPARLRGDLDAIVAQAMRREPGQRYPTVDALREDIARARALQPVRAHKGSRRYLIGRFVRRNRVAIAAAAAVMLTVIGGTAATAIQAHRAAVARDLALAEARRSDSIVQAVTLMLGGNPASGDQTLKQTLDQTAARMLATLDGSERSGQAVNALADLLVNIQNPMASFALLKGALDRGIGRDSQIATARMRAGLADSAVSIGQADIAPGLLDKADKVFQADPERYALDHQTVVLVRAAIARRKGDYPTAIALLSEDMPRIEQLLATNDSALLTRYNNLLVYLIEANRIAEIGPLFVQVDRTLGRPGARDTIQALNIDQLRASWQLRQGNAVAAEGIMANVAARRGRLFGETAGLGTDLTQLAKARLAQGNYVGAEAALLQALPIMEKYLSATALPTILTRLALAQALAEQGKIASARAAFAEAAAALAPLPGSNPLTGQLALTEAVVALKEGRKEVAAQAAARARTVFTGAGPSGNFGLTSIAAVERRIVALP